MTLIYKNTVLECTVLAVIHTCIIPAWLINLSTCVCVCVFILFEFLLVILYFPVTVIRYHKNVLALLFQLPKATKAK